MGTQSAATARIEQFLRGSGKILCVTGQVGSGKLHVTQLAAKNVGFQITILDRTQGPIHYNRLGSAALGGNGLAKSVFVVCGADAEASWPDPKSLPGGSKLILIGNDCRPNMVRAGLQVEQVNRPSPEAMTKTLFLDADWDVVRAQRLARLSGGDWRQLRALEMFFSNIDVPELSDDEFQRKYAGMTADKNPLDTSPSAAVHQLFSGHATKNNALERYADHSVLMWAEANKDVLCTSLEHMASLQESATFSDMLMSAGENELGLETFVRTAACATQPGMRYDFAKYRNPWAAHKDTPTVVAVRESWERQGSFAKRARERLAVIQQGEAAQARKRGAPKAIAKTAAKRKAAAPQQRPKQAATLPSPK